MRAHMLPEFQWLSEYRWENGTEVIACWECKTACQAFDLERWIHVMLWSTGMAAVQHTVAVILAADRDSDSPTQRLVLRCVVLYSA